MKAKIYTVVSFLIMAMTCEFVHGQIKDEPPDYKQVILPQHLREADVMWSKRIWRAIDLREKMNHPLYFPLEAKRTYKSLFDVIRDGIYEGTITAYDPVDDAFINPMTKEEVRSRLERIDTVLIPNFVTGELEPREIKTTIEALDMRQYRIKEDWYFDKQRSVLEPQIIGILLVAVKKDELGNEVGKQALFWIYYPEARYVFANQLVYIRNNDVKISYADLFWKRFFSSYIYKESNVYDRAINEYASGLNYQLESKRIHDWMFNFEHDLWEY